MAIARLVPHRFRKREHVPQKWTPVSRLSAEDFRKLRDSGRTGADLIAAMQACPYPDFEFEFPSVNGPVRDVEL